MKKLFTFLLLWLCLGFTLGTILLLGPLRATVDYGRKNLWSASAENKTVIGFIVVLAIVSAAIAWLCTNKILNKTTNNKIKVSLFAFPVFGIAFSIFVFMHPTLINAETSAKNVIKQGLFSFGPYPEEEKMQQLKEQGFTGVISLLHPAIVPFEPSLLDKEKKSAKAAGLQFVNIPLLPWISDNKESIDSLRKLAKTLKGKYYVHCYLGRDRVTAAMNILRQETNAVDAQGAKTTDKDLLNLKFERGNLITLEKGVYLAPFPTKEEFFKVIGSVAQVVSFSDNKSAVATSRKAEEEQWLASYKIPFKTYNVSAQTSKDKMLEVIKDIKSLPRPIFIHGFSTDDAEVVAFKNLYKFSLN